MLVPEKATPAEALLKKAENCLEMAEAQHDAADEQNLAADKLEVLAHELEAHAAQLVGEELWRDSGDQNKVGSEPTFSRRTVSSV
jgi:hypothetical protein